MIRPIANGDMEQVAKLYLELHRRSLYRKVKPCIATALQITSYLQATPNGFVRVAEHDGKVTGIIVVKAEEFWWADQQKGAKFASDLVFYSKRKGDGTQMLMEAIQWAWSRPRVICFETAASAGIKHHTAAAMYQAAGLSLHGAFWRVDHPKLSEH